MKGLNNINIYKNVYNFKLNFGQNSTYSQEDKKLQTTDVVCLYIFL